MESVEGYKKQLSELKQQIQDYEQMKKLWKDAERRNDILVAEIERLNKLVTSSNLESDEWKTKCSRIESTLLEYKRFEMTHRDMLLKAKQLADELDRVRNLLKDKHQELLDCQEELTHTQASLQEEKETNEDLRRQIEMLKSESQNDKFLLKIVVLTSENERLHNKINTQSQEILVLHDQINAMNNKYNDLLRKMDDLRQEFADRESELKNQLNDAQRGLENQKIQQMQQMQQIQSLAQQQSSTSQVQQPQFDDSAYVLRINELELEIQKLRASGGTFDDSLLRRQIQDQLSLIVLTFAEVEALRSKK